jgi:predicted lipid-binding transport protein (Tim44 family)
MSNNEFTTKEEQPSQDAAQPQKTAPANKWAQNAMHPEKILFQIWGLLALGIAIRVIIPMFATGGIMVIPGFAVLTVLVLPALLAGTTVYYNKNLKDAGRAWLIGSAAVTTAFGIYLLAWAVS